MCTLTDEALFTACAIVGAVLPDRVEGSAPKESSAYRKWRIRHRTWSHWPPIYLALIGAAYFAKDYFAEPTVDFALSLLTYAQGHFSPKTCFAAIQTKKPVICVETGTVYESITKAARSKNLRVTEDYASLSNTQSDGGRLLIGGLSISLNLTRRKT